MHSNLSMGVQQRNVMHNEEFLGFTTESRKIAFISN